MSPSYPKNRKEIATRKRQYIHAWLVEHPGSTIKEAGAEVIAHFSESLGQNDLAAIVKSVKDEHLRKLYENGGGSAPKRLSYTKSSRGSLSDIVKQMKLAQIKKIEILDDGLVRITLQKDGP